MGKMIAKLYIYDSTQEANAYRGEDFSSYILQGDSDTDDLTEILDVVELTLTGLPFSEEFAPKTKFIYEKWEIIDGQEQMWKDWHLCVARDIVSQPILSNNSYFDHAITFNEASVDGQGRLVDNIAVTYRLKDVSLESQPTYNTEAKAISRFVNVEWTPSENFGYGGDGNFYAWLKCGKQFKWVFPNWYTVNGKIPSKTDWTNFLLNQEVPEDTGTKEISLPLPMLQIYYGQKDAKTFALQGYCSLDVTVTETVISTNSSTVVKTFQMNPYENDDNEGLWNNGWEHKGDYPNYNLPKGMTFNRMQFYAGLGSRSNRIKRVALYDNERKNRTIDFVIKAGCSYSIQIKLHNFIEHEETQILLDKTNPVTYSYSGYAKIAATNNPVYTNETYPEATMNFNAVLASESKELYLRNAPTENAYNLYNKAFLTTQNHSKVIGTPIDETPKSYYLEEADKQELSNTIIVENFYNQKNWWELQLDIGKYIHAIPKVRFGSDDRFVTTWKKLGGTDIKDNRGNKFSIFNSRNVEEYVAACSSYVTNMVQLGGIIDEWVAPKSSSADYLVYNDVAEIITSKNIIELVNMEIKNVSCPLITESNAIRNIAGKGTKGEDPNGYVFEENIYNVLSINANSSVNKGLAIYYALGTNKIRGLNYQLPTINTGDADNEYAIKRIIGKVFGINPLQWLNIKVNDFIFHVIYRTKDTMRSDQTRPDLRKYILNSKHDRVPQHNQFSNQTDTVVDSVKFGSNVYGQLIRTGNTVYTETEWVDSLFNIKQSGELYEIRGNLYYVSKVKNTYYSNHIISEVEYSKDFNRLSQIVGIPSEPRFYEISEQSQIKREVSLNDYIVLGTSDYGLNVDNSFIREAGWGRLMSLMLHDNQSYPKYAVTVFKNDIEKPTVAGNETFCVEVCHPVSTYSIKNSLTFSWGMVDNFSAGDQVVGTTLSLDNLDVTNTAYSTLTPFRYPDVYGRADLMDFAIIWTADMTPEEVRLLPQNPIDIQEYPNRHLFGSGDFAEMKSNLHGLALLKDNRESLNFNYNIQLITDSDRFVLSSWLWQINKGGVWLALLNEEVNKISYDKIPNSIVVKELFLHWSAYDRTIRIGTSLGDEDLTNIKALAIISKGYVNNDNTSGARYFVAARNITGLTDAEKRADWYFSGVDKNMFPHN